MNCKENFFGIVIEILACPPESISLSENIMKERKYILNTDYVIGDSSETFLIPIKSKSAECTESFEEELPGTSYNVSITWQVHNPGIEDLTILQKLKDCYNHLIIRTLGDNNSGGMLKRYFVLSSADGYRFECNDNKGVLECKLSIININGLQRIFDE